MATQNNIDALVKKHREQRFANFLNPCFSDFRRVFNCEPPDVLVELYSLGGALSKTGNQFVTKSGTIWIESFCPLTSEQMNASSMRYNQAFLQIASGGEGQAYLCSVERPHVVWIDYGNDDIQLEELGIRIVDLAAAARASAQTV
jgi:hypothetical protein